jgi:transcription elongation GreA/GreB family factor
VTRTRAGILTLARVRSFAWRGCARVHRLERRASRRSVSIETSLGDDRRAAAVFAARREQAEQAFRATLERLDASKVSRAAARF